MSLARANDGARAAGCLHVFPRGRRRGGRFADGDGGGVAISVGWVEEVNEKEEKADYRRLRGRSGQPWPWLAWRGDVGTWNLPDAVRHWCARK